jgi:hypothetical protein
MWKSNSKIINYLLLIIATLWIFGILSCAGNREVKQTPRKIKLDFKHATQEDNYAQSTTSESVSSKKKKPETKPKPHTEYLVLQSPYGSIAAVNLYDHPDESSSIIDRLEMGSRLELIMTQGKWFKVKTQKGKYGWINLNKVSK